MCRIEMKCYLIVSVLSLVASQMCGHPYLPSGRITDSSDADPHSAPYMISIQIKQGSAYVHLCGGSILNEHWVVTAAHCVGSSAANLIMKAGRHNINANEKSNQERSIDYFKKHDLYLGGIMPFDIALFYTKTPFQWTNEVKPISLSKAGEIPTGTAVLFGWGNTSKNDKPSYPDTLQTAAVPIIPLQECQKVLGQGASLHETNLCTGPLSGTISACNADSGGPLVQINKNSAAGDVLIGVVSWGGHPCGQPNSPSVYVRVSAFIDWIKKVQSDYKA